MKHRKTLIRHNNTNKPAMFCISFISKSSPTSIPGSAMLLGRSAATYQALEMGLGVNPQTGFWFSLYSLDGNQRNNGAGYWKHPTFNRLSRPTFDPVCKTIFSVSTIRAWCVGSSVAVSARVIQGCGIQKLMSEIDSWNWPLRLMRPSPNWCWAVNLNQHS